MIWINRWRLAHGLGQSLQSRLGTQGGDRFP